MSILNEAIYLPVCVLQEKLLFQQLIYFFQQRSVWMHVCLGISLSSIWDFERIY